MRRNATQRKWITALALLAMGLSFMAQIAPLWVKQTMGQSIVICTAFGLETVTIDENGKRIPSDLPSNDTAARKHCAMCMASAQAALAPAAITLSPAPRPHLKAPSPQAYHLAAYSINVFSHGIRAPPFKS